jgi:5,10-methylenetetrahydromethanopterin reductase
MTGAPMPAGADSVIPVESTDGGSELVQIHASIEVGSCIRHEGEDVQEGDLVLVLLQDEAALRETRELRVLGVNRERPLTVMREVVTVVRALLNNETVTFDGYFAHLDGVELDYVHQERRPKDVPIYIGATGMQMMELTGELADGAVLNYLVSPKYNLDAIAALERGAAKAGRTLADIDRPQLVVCSVDRDRKAALDSARLLVTQYLGQQPHIMKASGVPHELLDEIGKVLTWPATHDQVVAASKLVPDEIVQMITASGEPDEVREKVGEYVANGCTCPILYPLGHDVRLMIDTFAGGI